MLYSTKTIVEGRSYIYLTSTQTLAFIKEAARGVASLLLYRKLSTTPKTDLGRYITLFFPTIC